MECVRKVVRQAHLPGIQQQDVQSAEHGLEHLVQLQREPVAVVQAHFLVQGLQVGRADHHHSPGCPVQESHQRPPDMTEPADVHLHRKGAKVGPDAEDHDGVRASRKGVELVGNIAQLARWDGGEADGWTMAAVLHQNIMGAVNSHERADIFRAVQVELL